MTTVSWCLVLINVNKTRVSKQHLNFVKFNERWRLSGRRTGEDADRAGLDLTRKACRDLF